MKHYFTFGQNHVHPLTGVAMRDYWVEFEGTFEDARNKMFELFGNKWSMHYEGSIDESYFPNGRYETITNGHEKTATIDQLFENALKKR